jgi:TPR repeat protein
MSVARGSDEETGPTLPATVRVGLKQIWDAPLTYDLLSRPASDTGPVFVGRETLLGPLVNAIGQPDRRGTYLVSGYRGVGKTSLIIQATRLAYPRLRASGWRLLPLVLNVSQISASLEAASDGGSRPLQIDARKLLTALLRKLLNWVLNSKDTSPNDLITLIEQAYQKANATRYTETQQQRVETLSTAVRESRRTFQVPDILKLVAAVSLLAAATVEGIALLGSFVNQLHILAIGMTGIAILSFQRSFILTRSSTEGVSTSSELVLDNSLHQLETELQDILEQLYQQKYRTLIILEELDKIEDEKGQQLDSVIRYFKNLFTQAPALFFFLTDKAYYDLVSEKIEIARRQRSYAIEHTFFTHRLFVSRPGIEECLQYLLAVYSSADDCSEVEAVIRSQSDRVRVRRLESMLPLEQVLRVLLFRSHGHFFDLKNEMRQFVHVAGTESWLEVDKGSMPKSERALAGFHFLVEQKMLSYRFSGGRDYADEALRSCLFAVFEALGSAEPQEIVRFYPSLGSDGDQLTLSEYRRIVEAVDSLVDDLERGKAITRLAPDMTEDQHAQAPKRFIWRDDAAVRFEPVARLEPHELTLLNDLSRIAKVAEWFSPNGQLQELADDPDKAKAKALFENLSLQVQALEQSPIAIPIEESISRRRQAARDITPFLELAFTMHQRRLVETFGLALTPISKVSPPDAFILSTGDSQADRPVFLLYESIGQDGQEVRLADQPLELERFAVVYVTLPGSFADPDQTLRDSRFPTLATDLPGNRLHSIKVPLDERLEARHSEHEWGERTADELRFAQLWCQHDISSDGRREPSGVSAAPYVLFTSDETINEAPSLHKALSAWLKSTDMLLAWSSTIGPPREVIEKDLMFDQDNESRAIVVEFPPDKEHPIRFTSEREMDEKESASLTRLIEKRRVILGLFNQRPPKIQDTLRTEPWSRAHTLAEINELPATLNSVSVLHPIDPNWSHLTSLVDLVQQRYPDYAISILQPAAEAGNTSAMARLAILLTDRKNRAESRKWLAQLVQSEDLQAISDTAVAIAERDPDGAVQLNQAAAEAGDTNAMARLVTLLTDRDDREEAGKWRTRLAKSRDLYKMYEVARTIEHRDPEGAIELYQAAAEAGVSHAWLPLLVLLTGRDPEEAGRWRARLAQSNDTSTMTEIAQTIEEVDPEGAAELYRAAIQQDQAIAEHGNVEAMERLVVLLTGRDPEEAGRWRARLAQSNDLGAISDTARAIEDRDPEGAIELYEAAAEAGRVGAMERLVTLLAERNPEESRKWRTQLEKRREGSKRRTTTK